MNEHDFAELSAGRALNALSPDDELRYLDALAEHPEWQHIADDDAATAASLSEGATAVSPPVELRSRLLAMIAASDTASTAPENAAPATVPDEAAPATGPLPTDVVQTVQRRNWSRGLFALVASMVLLVGVGWGIGAVASRWQTPPAVTALQQIQDAPDAASAEASFDGGDATVHWSESLGKTVLVAEGLPAIDTDQTFELWYVRGGNAIAAGTFDAEDGQTNTELTGQMEPGDTIAVTVEPSGGSPDGSPSSDPILAVPTA